MLTQVTTRAKQFVMFFSITVINIINNNGNARLLLSLVLWGNFLNAVMNSNPCVFG